MYVQKGQFEKKSWYILNKSIQPTFRIKQGTESLTLNSKADKDPTMFTIRLQVDNQEITISTSSPAFLTLLSRVGGLNRALSAIFLFLTAGVSGKLFISHIIDEMFLIKKHK